MRVAVFSAKPHDIRYFDSTPQNTHEFSYFETRLTPDTVSLAVGFDAVCVFVNDQLDRPVIERLAKQGIKVVALRCVGFNNVDLHAAEQAGMIVVRVPAYSPAAVAEHTIALMLTLSRHLHKAYSRVRDGNFMLRGLEGFTFKNRVAGIIGTGQIGTAVARILHGMGMQILAYDPHPNRDYEGLDVTYVELDSLIEQAEVITLHCPLNHSTHHLIDAARIARMKPGVMLINTSRGAVLDTSAVVKGLKSGQIGYLGLDVYEQEGDLFFRDLSNQIIQDDVFQRLLTFPNVVVTGHLGFFTTEALTQIAKVTIRNLDFLDRGEACPNRVLASEVLVNH